MVESAQDIGAEEVQAPQPQGVNQDSAFANVRPAPANPHDIHPQLPTGPAGEVRLEARQQRALNENWRQTVEQMATDLLCKEHHPPVMDLLEQQFLLAMFKTRLTDESFQSELAAKKGFTAVKTTLESAHVWEKPQMVDGWEMVNNLVSDLK